jgi:peptidoglycan-associated lipoprotein
VKPRSIALIAIPLAEAYGLLRQSCNRMPPYSHLSRQRRRKQMRLILAVMLSLLLAACSTSDQGGTSNTGAGGSGQVSTGSAGPAPGTQAELNQTIGDRVFFDTDRYNIDGAASGTVQAWAQWLARNPNVSVLIEGHCDERGTRDYNFALGARRSHAIKAALQSMGIDGSRIETTTFGKERPAALGSNPTAWSKNRRAVMVVKG